MYRLVRRVRGEGSVGAIILIIGIILLAIGGITACTNQIAYQKGLGGHIRNAAVANTIELAKSEMEKVVEAAKAGGHTSGFTSVLYNTPEEDVGFWFRNMESSLAELKELSGKESSQLERSNTLLKLHETLSHAPDGLSNHPNNVMIGLLLIIGIILALLGLAACSND